MRTPSVLLVILKIEVYVTPIILKKSPENDPLYQKAGYRPHVRLTVESGRAMCFVLVCQMT